MTTTSPHFRHHVREHVESRADSFLVPAGRVLFALIFLQTVPLHFSEAGIRYAAAHGVPAAGLLVPLSGVLAFVGGLSVALGYFARIGALLLALFLIPVTLTMHAFWAIPDPDAARMQYTQFLKNVALFGATLLIAHFAAGPFSIDSRTRVPD